MPSYTRGIKRENIKFVRVNRIATVYYGFNQKDFSAVTGVSEGDISVLGHIDANAVPEGSIKILRANSPKPARVKKRINSNPNVSQQGSISTWCSAEKINEALSNRWTLVSPAQATKCTRAREGARSVTALAAISDGSYYAFSMNKADFDANKSALGLVDIGDFANLTDQEKWGMIVGSSFPKPGRVSKSLENGAIQSHFYSSDNADAARQAGWDINSEERFLE